MNKAPVEPANPALDQSITVDAEKEAKKATILAAMERAKAQREAAQIKNTDNLNAQQQRDIAEIEARREVIQPAATAPVDENKA